MKPALTFLLLVGIASSALADGTRDAFAKLKDAQAQSQKIQQEQGEKAKAAATQEEKMKIWREGWEKGAALTEPAEKAFLEAFDKSDWNSWDPEKDAELLEEGLTSVGQEFVEKDAKHAVEAWELLLKKLPKCGSANYVRATWMPIGLPSTGDLDHAEKRLAEIAAEVEETWKPDVLMGLGDVKALKGDFEGAQAQYAEALKLIPEGADPMKDPRGRSKGYLELRKTFIGTPAPEIDTKTWYGAEAKPLSAFKGNVVLLEFWATW